MIDMTSTTQADTVRQLNDLLRQTGVGGRTVLTRSVLTLPTEDLAAVLRAVAAFDDFTADNDPYGEHDCASLEVQGHRVMWKIDYYNPDLSQHSSDPANPAITTRVLTVMLSNEY